MSRKSKRKPEYSDKSRTVFLYPTDDKSFEAMMKTDGLNTSECLRKIVAEYFSMKRMQTYGYDQTNVAVKRAQSEVLAPFKETLDTLNNNQDEMQNTINNLIGVVTTLVKTSNSNRNDLEESLERRFGSIKGELNETTNVLKELELATKLSAVNIITLRGLFYLFLIHFNLTNSAFGNLDEAQAVKLAQDVVVQTYRAAKEEQLDYTKGTDYEDIGFKFFKLFQSKLSKVMK